MEVAIGRTFASVRGTSLPQVPQYHRDPLRPSRLIIVLKSLRWWLTAIAILALVGFTRIESLMGLHEYDFANGLAAEELVLLVGAILILVVQTTYWILYRTRYSVSVRRGMMIIHRGVLFPSVNSIPIAKLTQIQIGRNFSHLLLGLYYIRLSIPALPEGEVHSGSSHHLIIEALSRRDAMRLKVETSRVASHQDH